ncbi:MAG TPA: hypothetical protein VF731_05980 [Solirubrobacterales bacterium]
MNRKLVVLALAAVLALAIVVPSLAQPAAVSPRVSTALPRRAMRMARTSLRTAQAAKAQSRAAEELAQGAAATAKAASATAAATQAALESHPVGVGVAEAAAGTAEETFVALPGGPKVSVEVPSSGLIEVWAQATMDGGGAVALYEDGGPVSGQSAICSSGKGEPGLFALSETPPEPVSLGTPATPGFPPFCGATGAPAAVLFRVAPGTHTYELRYASCGCSPEPVTFSDRRLYVAPRP